MGGSSCKNPVKRSKSKGSSHDDQTDAEPDKEKTEPAPKPIEYKHDEKTPPENDFVVYNEDLKEELSEDNDTSLQLQKLREELVKQHTEYEEKLRERDHKLTTALEEQKGLETTIKRLTVDNKNYHDELAHSKELLEEVEKVKEQLKQKNAEFQEQVMDLENKLKQKDERITGLESEVGVKVEKIQDVREQRRELKDDLYYKEDKIKNLKDDLKKLKDELRWWTKIERPIIVARGHHPSDAGEELLNQAVSQLSQDVKVMSKDSSSLSRQDGVLVVPCIISSRVETDIDACLSQLQLPPGVRVVLIVFQHVAKENSRLPAMSTDERLAAKFQQCDVIYDAHYWQGQFYRCKVNDLFMGKFEKFLTIR